MPENIDIPDEWNSIRPSRLSGLVMVVGGPDVGKSTFARFLYEKLCKTYPSLGFIDGDAGQTYLGPPSTLTLALNGERQEPFPPQGECRRWFVGSTSPRGHMLQVLIGSYRLAMAGFRKGARTIVWDTSGFISPSSGGTTLKWAKIDLVQPSTVIAIQRSQELEPLLAPLRYRNSPKLAVIRPSPEAVRRDAEQRRSHRTDAYSRYFTGARSVSLACTRFAVYPGPVFDPGRLVALEDGDGFATGLGVVRQFEPEKKELVLWTPLSSLKGIRTLRVGDLALDPETFSDRWLALPRIF